MEEWASNRNAGHLEETKDTLHDKRKAKKASKQLISTDAGSWQQDPKIHHSVGSPRQKITMQPTAKSTAAATHSHETAVSDPINDFDDKKFMYAVDDNIIAKVIALQEQHYADQQIHAPSIFGRPHRCPGLT